MMKQYSDDLADQICLAHNLTVPIRFAIAKTPYKQLQPFAEQIKLATDHLADSEYHSKHCAILRELAEHKGWI
jgi:hypothetical protein